MAFFKSLSRVRFIDLIGVAGVVGMVGGIISLSIIHQIYNKVKKQPYYRNAFKTLRQNTAAIELIGEPIYGRRMDFSDRESNNFEDLSVTLKIPFKGSKKKGDLYVWADRETNESEWTLRRLEMIFSDIQNQKVIVYKNES